MSKILVYMANGLGNCIFAIPAIKSLQSLGYKIDLAIPADWPRSRPLFELFSTQPFIDKIFTSEVNITTEEYLRIFIPSTHERSRLQSFLKAAANSVTVQRPAWRETLVHEAEFLMSMPRSLGYRGARPTTAIKLEQTGLEFTEPYIALAFSCLDGYPWVLKKWPRSYWTALILILLDEFPGHNFLLIGAKNDASDAQAICEEAASDRVRNCCGLYTILESAFILSRSRLLITIDNGISHLATAAGSARVVVLYGPTLLSKNAPIGDSVLVLRTNMPCSPCFDSKLFRKCKVNVCLRTLTPRQVAAHVCSLVWDA
jgi:ADP-heptose:LPS heptosyltransferase